MGIIQGLRKKEKSNPRGGTASNAPEVPRKLPDTTAPLMLMLPDAAGVAAYHLNVFPSQKAAEFYIDSTLRGTMPEGGVMFWALNWEPKGIARAEPLVLIRDGHNVVYPFSFSDLDSALDFVRHEMKSGLHLFQVMIYWAVPAKTEADFWGRSTIVPPAAPRCRPRSVLERPIVQEVASMELPHIPAPEVADDSERFLQDGDIAEAVRQANHIATHTEPQVPDDSGNVVSMPTPAPSSHKSKSNLPRVHVQPIDFATASQKVEESRAARAAINAWSNFAQALDEALDVHVARLVATKLAWNRISRAVGRAIEAKLQFDVEQAGPRAREESRAEESRPEAARTAAAESARLEEERLVAARAVAAEAALSVGSVELANAENVVAKRKAIRKAWLNATWTLEEAAYAYILEQKSRAIRTWRILCTAITQAVAARLAYEASMRAAWSNAGTALAHAHRVHVARLQMLQRSWATGATQIRIVVLMYQRMSRVRAGLHNFSIALEEAFEAKAYRDEVIEAWGAAIDGIGSAVHAKLYCDKMTAGWGNVAIAIEGVCRAYILKQKRAVHAWGRLAKALGSIVHAKIKQDAAVDAWTSISFALEDAVFARRRYLGLVAAWRTGSEVLSDGARRTYINQQQSIAAWQTATVSFKLAVVAEAKVRIATARVERKQIMAIDRMVKAAMAKPRSSRKGRTSVDLENAALEQFVPPMASTHVVLPDELLPDDFENEFDKLPDAISLDERDEMMGDLFADDTNGDEPIETKNTPLFPGLWRSHESGHWKPREEPFRGFRSPPGRFRHRERDDNLLIA